MEHQVLLALALLAVDMQHHQEGQLLDIVLPVVVEAQVAVDMEHQVEVEAHLVVGTVLHLVDQVLLAQDMVLLVEGGVLLVVDMVGHQMIRTANKYPDKTAKVFLSKYRGNKEEENKEQFVKWPTPVTITITIIMEVVFLVGCSITMVVCSIMETMEIVEVEGQDVMEVVPTEEEEEEDLHTQGNRRH